MARAKRVCPSKGCTNLTDGGRCADCARAADRARGTASQRGYRGRGHTRRFRLGVLHRDRLCVLHLEQGLPVPATVADHWPRSRRELLELGLDPNDPAHGRGLCTACHNRETAAHQPGGWNTPGG
jgi:5-methylcytosine-specific restriction protein A